MDIEQFKTFIIQPALKPLSLWTPEAESILCSTMATESLGGRYVKQISGPALGPYQMEPKSHDDLWRTKFSRPDRLQLIKQSLDLFGFSRMPKATDMIWHWGYATFMARMYYKVINYPLPAHDDLTEQWKYYKRFWNTDLGSATEEQFMKNVRKYKGLKK